MNLMTPNHHISNDSPDKSVVSLNLSGETSSASFYPQNSKSCKLYNDCNSHQAKALLPQSQQRDGDGSSGPKVGCLQHEPGQFGTLLLRTQIVGALVSSFIHLMGSMMQGFSGITLPQMTDRNSSDIFLDKDQASLFSSIFNLGCLIGGLLTGPFVVLLGHRLITLLLVPGSMVAWIVMSQTSSYGTLQTMRVIHGIILGVLIPCSTNYLTEISHSSIRGRMMGIRSIIRQIGFLVLYSVGGSGLSWRNVALICGVLPAIIPFLIFIFLPNSPRWLGTKERFQEAHSSLTFFRGKNYNVTPELEEIKEDILKKGRSKSILDQLKILREKSIVKRVIIVSMITFMNGFIGNMTILSYSATIFQLANTGFNELTSSIVSISTRVLGACAAIASIDKFGRKPLLSIPLFFSGLCMMVFALFFYLQTLYEDHSSISWMPLAALLLYNFLMTIYMNTIIMLESELLPSSVRAITSGIFTVAAYVAVFIGIMSYQYLIDGIGPQWTFFFYGFNCFLVCMLTFFAIPETKGKSLEEIEKLFS